MLLSLTYPQYVAWRINLANITDAYQIFGKKSVKRLKSAFKTLESTNWRFQIDTVDEAYLERFVPMYVAHMSTKENPRIYDVKDMILNSPRKTPYQAVSLYEGDQYHGGHIFGVRDDCLSSAFKVYPLEINVHLPINITFVGEYHYYQHAISLHKPMLFHGLGLNCFGINSAIGLATFKLQAGAYPISSTQAKNTIKHAFDWDGTTDVLIFEGTEGQLKKGKLLLTGKNPIEKYGAILSHPDLQIETVDWGAQE